MPLVTTTEMFKKAYNGGYAIGAFNVNNMEIVQGITEAAGAVSYTHLMRCFWKPIMTYACFRQALTPII